MPLTYQGSLTKKVFQTPIAALKYGQQLLQGAGHPRRRDVRLAWESFEPIECSVDLLGHDFDGFWFDIAVEPTDYAIEHVVEWAATLSGGQVSAVCLKDGAEAEVSVSLPELGNERFDRPRCDVINQAQLKEIRVRTAQLHRPGEPTKARKTTAAARCHGAYMGLLSVFEDPVPSYEQWIGTHADEGQFESQWLTAEDAQSYAWLMPPDEPIPLLDWSTVHTRPRIISGCPTEISSIFPMEHRRHAISVWTQWTNQLSRVDALVLRLRGTLETLRTLFDEVDLYHYHPHHASQTYGLTTVHAPVAVDPATQDSLLTHPDLTRHLSDWDIRWSDLSLNIGEGLGQQLGRTQNHYLIRTERARTIDRLTLSLELDDPQDSLFRSARRHLASQFGDALGREAAWEYDGPTLDSPQGRHYRRLQDEIVQLLAHIDDTPDELPVAPARTLIDFLPFIGGHHLDGRALVEKFADAINRALPGFRYDRRAHITDKYFLEFVRRTSHGYNVIEVQRYVRPHGFSVRLASSRFRIPFADLMPGSGRAVPGYVVSLHTLVPERPERWNYKKARRLDRVLDDLSVVLEKRGRRFFDGTEKIFADCFGEQKESI
ncbi:MAG: hypothetical protein VX589_07435 [Myxococcota bacterium]|nr:hypothetical protein [Myxococcota bacterium]